MSEIILPRWANRRDVTRKDKSRDYSGLAEMVVKSLHFYQMMYDVVAPYEARQRQTDELTDELLEYTPPTQELFKQLIRNPHFISKSRYDHAVRGMVEFCEINKRMFALPVPHPTTIHSIQLPEGSFKIDRRETVDLITIEGYPFTLQVDRMGDLKKIKHMVLRPKSSSSGTANLSQWELLTFDESHGYIPLWVDSTANPRFAGTL